MDKEGSKSPPPQCTSNPIGYSVVVAHTVTDKIPGISPFLLPSLVVLRWTRRARLASGRIRVPAGPGLPGREPSLLVRLSVDKLTGSRSQRILALVFQQPLLAPEAAGVATEGAVGADHAVARDHQRQHVGAVGAADGARGFGYS